MSSFDTPAAFSDDELLALLRDETVLPAAISAEMEDAGATPLAEAALTEARGLMKALGPAAGPVIERLPPQLRTLLVDVAMQQRSVELLALLVQSADKTVVKEAKRAIHTLKTQGLKVETSRPTAPPRAAPVEEKPAAYMTSIDGAGQRVVFFTASARGGVDVAQLMISDVTGVVSADFAPLGRKEYRRFLDKLESATETLVAEVPRPYARGLVARSLDLNARARRPVPQRFNEVAFLLGPAVTPQPSPGRELPRPEDEAALAARGHELLLLKELRAWGPSETIWSAFDAQADGIVKSALYIDEGQRTASLRALAASSAEAFWTREQCALYAERLFDTGYLLSRIGRGAEAQIALATAWALVEERPIETIAFAAAFFERLLPAPSETTPAPHEPASPGGSGLIIPG